MGERVKVLKLKSIYNIIEAQSLSALIDRVNIAMDDGWRLQGGVSCVTFPRPDGLISYRFMQTMVRYEEQPNSPDKPNGESEQ